ncbi:cell surface A33 antigen-like isoform X2 [Melanerpes formicivorus]|uniref:cell surface A33 antigen-like isoform X2 n=1 Tax=Melanerpes formicivorus TaxID=211600 RepID=UPI00358E752F
MSTWLLVAIRGSLLLSLQVSPSVVEITEKQLAAVGSSVLLRAPSIGNANLTDWEVVRRGTSHLILQYYANVQAPTIYPAYQGRVVFYPENGSMLLQRLQETDSGIYVATVDLMHDKARTILLEVIKPVSQPELQSSSNLAGSSIELLCVVPEGMVASISWKKDGHPLPPEKLCLLSENNTLLQIRSGGKSDCGSYSCNISNEISWKEATTSLVVTGLTPALLHLQRLSVVTLIFIASSAIGFLTLLCWPREPSRGNKARKRVRVSSYVLLCVSSVLLFAISISWMHEEGLSAAFLLLGLFFFGAAIGSAWAAAALLWRPAARSRLKAHVWLSITHSSTASTTLMVNLLFTTFLFHSMEKHGEQGCSDPVGLRLSYVSAAVAIIISIIRLLIVPLQCHRKRVELCMDRDLSNQEAANMVEAEFQGQSQEGKTANSQSEAPMTLPTVHYKPDQTLPKTVSPGSAREGQRTADAPPTHIP